MRVLKPVLWMLCGAALLAGATVGIWAYQISHWPTDPTEDGWEEAGPIAVSDRWTLAFFQQTAHPFLAEYHYKVQLYRNETPREAKFAGEFPLSMNTGGRTELALYLHLDESANPTDLEFVQEQVERINPGLRVRDYITLGDPAVISTEPHSVERRFLGKFDGQSAPLKFVPAQR